jgi:hypothetical protein
VIRQISCQLTPLALVSFFLRQPSAVRSNSRTARSSPFVPFPPVDGEAAGPSGSAVAGNTGDDPRGVPSFLMTAAHIVPCLPSSRLILVFFFSSGVSGLTFRGCLHTDLRISLVKLGLKYTCSRTSDVRRVCTDVLLRNARMVARNCQQGWAFLALSPNPRVSLPFDRTSPLSALSSFDPTQLLRVRQLLAPSLRTDGSTHWALLQCPRPGISVAWSSRGRISLVDLIFFLPVISQLIIKVRQSATITPKQYCVIYDDQL